MPRKTESSATIQHEAELGMGDVPNGEDEPDRTVTVTDGPGEAKRKQLTPGKENKAPEGAEASKTPSKSSPEASKAVTNILGINKIHWKIAKAKYGVFNYMCARCRVENFQSRFSNLKVQKLGNLGERLLHTQTYCAECVKLNIDVTDMIARKEGKAAPFRQNQEENKQ